jgi:hypothetical protein
MPSVLSRYHIHAAESLQGTVGDVAEVPDRSADDVKFRQIFPLQIRIYIKIGFVKGKTSGKMKVENGELGRILFSKEHA